MSRIGIRHTWIALTLAAAFIGPASSPIGLPDVYWTLLSGAWMIAHGALLTSDPFTAAPHVGGPLTNVQWLAALIFQAWYMIAGLPLVITATALVVMAAYGCVLAAAVTASGHLRLSCVAVWLGYALGASNLSPRPQTLAYPLFGLFLLAVMRAEWRKDERLLWLLPPATALWANIHGSFFTGFVVLACAALARVATARALFAARPYVLALAACVVASLLNPYGVGSLLYVATIGSNPVIRDLVTEWAPTTVSWHEGIMFFGSIVLLGALMLRSRLRLTLLELLLLLVFGYLAWSSVRAIVWWGLIITPILARLLGSVVPNRLGVPRENPPLNAVIIALIGALVLVSLPWFKSSLTFLPEDKRGLIASDTPVAVGEYLRSHDPPNAGAMLNNQNWGGYLEWATWPRHIVFLDGRIELHPTQVWFDYLDIVFPSARWRALMDQYAIGYVVLSKVDQADLVADLRDDGAWRLDYEDDRAVVLSREALSGSAP